MKPQNMQITKATVSKMSKAGRITQLELKFTVLKATGNQNSMFA